MEFKFQRQLQALLPFPAPPPAHPGELARRLWLVNGHIIFGCDQQTQKFELHLIYGSKKLLSILTNTKKYNILLPL